MRILFTAMLVLVTADGGVSPEFQRDVILARAACMDSDGGVPQVRIADCVVTCIGDVGEARLVDGGVCYPPPKLVPVQGGDFWLPGQRPFERKPRQ